MIIVEREEVKIMIIIDDDDKKKNDPTSRNEEDTTGDAGEKGGMAEYDEDIDLGETYESNEPDEADIVEDDRM